MTVSIVTDERSFEISTVGLHYPVTQNRSFAINNSTNSNMRWRPKQIRSGSVLSKCELRLF